jgi:hypothetical protein
VTQSMCRYRWIVACSSIALNILSWRCLWNVPFLVEKLFSLLFHWRLYHLIYSYCKLYSPLRSQIFPTQFHTFALQWAPWICTFSLFGRNRSLVPSWKSFHVQLASATTCKCKSNFNVQL